MAVAAKLKPVCIIGGLTGLLAGGTSEMAPRPTDSICNGSPTSSWSAGGNRYLRSQVFGKDESQWLVEVTGIVVHRERVYVYDGREAVVHVLTPTLTQISKFGRRGNGPGELAIPLRPHTPPNTDFTANYLAADDSLVYLYDGRSVQAYTADGRYVSRVARLPQGSVPFSVRVFQATPAGLMYSIDSLDVFGARRNLQTWRIAGDVPRLIHAVSLRPPAIEDNRWSTTSRRPRPIWGAWDQCIVYNDGSSRALVRINVANGRRDTVQLPVHQVPPDTYDPRIARGRNEALGLPIPPMIRDTTLWRYAGLIVDPSGHIWIRPWTGNGIPDGPVFRIDPSGRVHPEHVPAFPVAFGTAGVFYARETDWQTREPLIVRYERQQR